MTWYPETFDNLFSEPKKSWDEQKADVMERIREEDSYGKFVEFFPTCENCNSINVQWQPRPCFDENELRIVCTDCRKEFGVHFVGRLRDVARCDDGRLKVTSWRKLGLEGSPFTWF